MALTLDCKACCLSFKGFFATAVLGLGDSVFGDLGARQSSYPGNTRVATARGNESDPFQAGHAANVSVLKTSTIGPTCRVSWGTNLFHNISII